MAGGRFTGMATGTASGIDVIMDALKPTSQSLQCSELRAGGADLKAVIDNHKRIEADPACRKAPGMKGPS
jgi:hypothetical protein